METNIVAGRCDGQKSPSLNFLYLDGSFASHKAMDSLRFFRQNQEESINFLSFPSAVKNNSITWSWMKPVKV